MSQSFLYPIQAPRRSERLLNKPVRPAYSFGEMDIGASTETLPQNARKISKSQGGKAKTSKTYTRDEKAKAESIVYNKTRGSQAKGSAVPGKIPGIKKLSWPEERQIKLLTYLQTQKSTSIIRTRGKAGIQQHETPQAMIEDTHATEQSTTIVRQETTIDSTTITKLGPNRKRKHEETDFNDENNDDVNDSDYMPEKSAAKKKALSGVFNLGDYGSNIQRPYRKVRDLNRQAVTVQSSPIEQRDMHATANAEVNGPIDVNSTAAVAVKEETELSQPFQRDDAHAAADTEVNAPDDVERIAEVKSEPDASELGTAPKRRVIIRPATGWDLPKHRFSFKHSPFPNHAGPSHEEAYKIYNILYADIEKHNSAALAEFLTGPVKCAAAAVTVDAIVRTIMSQATNNGNALLVQKLLRERYTYTVNGQQVIGQTPNYHDIRLSSEEELASVIQSAGCQNKRAMYIKAALDKVYDTNIASLTALNDIPAGNPPNAPDFVPGRLSLAFLKDKSQVELMNWYLDIKGVGIKTAFCILAFNYKLPLCAVDIHVWNVAMWLDWLPADCKDPNAACMHLDLYLPEELKYNLHQAIWEHRQYCKGCKGKYDDDSQAKSAAECPLRPFMTRFPVKKRSPRKFSLKEAEVEGEKTKEPSKALKRTRPFAELTATEAAELGYKEITVDMNSDFAAGSAYVRVKKVWVLQKSH